MNGERELPSIDGWYTQVNNYFDHLLMDII